MTSKMEYNLLKIRHLSTSFLLLGVFFHCAKCSDDNEVDDPIPQCRLKNSLACSMNNFGASLMRTVSEEQNVFISPISIYIALAMTYLGARGETAEQMAEVLQVQSFDAINQTEFHTALKGLLEAIRVHDDDDDAYSLLIANGVFMQHDSNVTEDYINDIHNFYHSSVKLVNFAAGPGVTRDIINRFVAEHTADMIPECLNEPLDPRTVLALLNVIYFKGTWQTKFSEEKTMKGTFHISSSETKEVDFMNMHQQDFRYYANSAGDKFLELPYKNRHMSMIIVLSAASRTLEYIMDSEELANVKNRLRRRIFTRVALPKFHLEYQKELVPLLQQLGIEDLFQVWANLKGISENEDISVSSISHQAVVDVNEEGSEAAAVTMVLAVARSSELPPSYYFIADRPFAFYIIDNRNDLILFSGLLSDP